MEFEQEALVKREIEIAAYLLRNFSPEQIAGQLGINKKIVQAHIRNMMQKLNVANIEVLKQSVKTK